MVSINTNLSSLLVQSNLANSTNALNTAIERMTTGFKINHAKDNAANYSISTNLSSQLSSYGVAQDNVSMGVFSRIENKRPYRASRKRDLRAAILECYTVRNHCAPKRDCANRLHDRIQWGKTIW